MAAVREPVVPLASKCIFIGLFTLTSSGCRSLVTPPGMITRSIFMPRSSDLMDGIRWQRNESSTNIAFLRSRPSGCVAHTVLIQSRVRASSIHPFGWTRTWTPRGNRIPLGKGLAFEDDVLWHLPPSAVYANMTVKWLFSWPVVLIETVFTPFSATVRSYGRSNVSDV